MNYSKCSFLADQIKYCGYIIDKHGIHKTKAKIEAIQNASVPTNKKCEPLLVWSIIIQDFLKI